MKKTLIKISFFVLITWLTVPSFAQTKVAFETAVRKSVLRQLEIYPEMTLQDLYKSFFQDRFGPGHIINDTTSAGKYLDEELASCEQMTGAYYEPTGYEGNFYRVNLSIIKKGIITRDAYFDAFLRSVKNIQPISVEEWKKEWMKIDTIIYTMNLSLHDYTQDRKNIFALLAQGKYVVHHSSRLIKTYDPHYRIIERSIFMKEILPLLK